MTATATTRSTDTITSKLQAEEWNYVFAVVMKYVKDDEVARDVTQEAMLLAHRHRHTFRGDSKYSTWLYRVAATTALMYLRKRKRRQWETSLPTRAGDLQSDRSFAIRDRQSGCDDQVGAAQAAQMVAERIDEMGDKYRDVFWMRYRDGYSEPEIARRLGLRLSTVKTRAFRARHAARATLADNGYTLH